jgi:hypothetical protein
LSKGGEFGEEEALFFTDRTLVTVPPDSALVCLVSNTEGRGSVFMIRR